MELTRREGSRRFPLQFFHGGAPGPSYPGKELASPEARLYPGPFVSRPTKPAGHATSRNSEAGRRPWGAVFGEEQGGNRGETLRRRWLDVGWRGFRPKLAGNAVLPQAADL